MSRRKKMPEAPPILGRVCWSCENCDYDSAEPGYSEYTPGSDFALSCSKNYWVLDTVYDTIDVFRKKLMSAESCADFKLHPAIAQKATK